jgi:hypothetical protein
MFPFVPGSHSPWPCLEQIEQVLPKNPKILNQFWVCEINKGFDGEMFKVGTSNKGNWWALIVITFVECGSIHFLSGS